MEIYFDLQIKTIAYNSEEYRQELVLRDEVLRKPLGMSLYAEDLTVDAPDFHLGAFLSNRLVGVLLLKRLNADELKMRQVAVVDTMRSQHVGTALVRFAEEYAIREGYKTMLLNARMTAVGFYEKLGYEKISREFMEINIPHYRMNKKL